MLQIFLKFHYIFFFQCTYIQEVLFICLTNKGYNGRDFIRITSIFN